MRQTLSKTDGHYASLYDNIWYVPSEWPKASGDVFLFPDYLGISHLTARADVSDHAPIYLSVTGETLALLPLEGSQPQAAGGRGRLPQGVKDLQFSQFRPVSTSTPPMPTSWISCRISGRRVPQTSSVSVRGVPVVN